MWLVFLKYKVKQSVPSGDGVYACDVTLTWFHLCLQLPGSLYKKILVILHESIMPQMSDPTLMIDFLTAAYDIGE